MLGYKGTGQSKSSFAIDYGIGEIYEFLEESNINFYENFIDVNNDYRFQNDSTSVYEVEILGPITKVNKLLSPKLHVLHTNKFKILREIPRSEWEKISNGKVKFDEKGNLIYLEKPDTYFWEKHQYDEKNQLIYSEYSDGFWKKFNFDEQNNLIFLETSERTWEKLKYDNKNNLIKYSDSSGFWEEAKYNENNHLVFYRNSERNFKIFKYDENNNRIYSVDSDEHKILRRHSI